MYNYKPSYYDGDVIYFKATIKTNDAETEDTKRLVEYYSSKKAGGYGDFYNNENLTIKGVPVGHDYLLSVEALMIINPELIKFIER